MWSDPRVHMNPVAPCCLSPRYLEYMSLELKSLSPPALRTSFFVFANPITSSVEDFIVCFCRSFDHPNKCYKPSRETLIVLFFFLNGVRFFLMPETQFPARVSYFFNLSPATPSFTLDIPNLYSS